MNKFRENYQKKFANKQIDQLQNKMTNHSLNRVNENMPRNNQYNNRQVNQPNQNLQNNMPPNSPSLLPSPAVLFNSPDSFSNQIHNSNISPQLNQNNQHFIKNVSNRFSTHQQNNQSHQQQTSSPKTHTPLPTTISHQYQPVVKDPRLATK